MSTVAAPPKACQKGVALNSRLATSRAELQGLARRLADARTTNAQRLVDRIAVVKESRRMDADRLAEHQLECDGCARLNP